jgi:hypothetical protein
MKVIPLQISFARDSYLCAPSGHARYIQHLGPLICLGEEAGARFSWAQAEDLTALMGFPTMGVTGIRTLDVMLNFDLFGHDDWVVRRVFAHEIGHCVNGFPESKANKWARKWDQQFPASVISPEFDAGERLRCKA